jgi:YesN/AraC family two-component response regulator
VRILISSNIEAQNLYKGFAATDYKIDICHLDDLAEAIDQFHPKLILLHCGCKVKNCLQTLATVKNEYPAIPVIFLTRISAEHIAIEAFRLGAKDYFKEPMDFQELLETIHNLNKYISQSADRRKAILSPISIVANHLDETLPFNVAKVISFMEKNLAKDISLNQLAKKATMSKHHFCRVFKKHTGITPMQYLTRKRIEQAKILLLDEDMVIGDVITAVGFQDQSNFIKNFKKVEGVTPSFYRRDNICSRNRQVQQD